MTKRKLLSQNSKMKKSSDGEVKIFNFAIPAILTCLAAMACKLGCFATMSCYRWEVVKNKHQWNLEETKLQTFVDKMMKEIQVKLKTAKRAGHKVWIRIHDSGDFYSLAYFLRWRNIAMMNEDAFFYFYTKMVPLIRKNDLPSNMTFCLSFGGKYDEMIDLQKDRHSIVVPNKESIPTGYVDASDDDTLMVKHQKIALVYHGDKKWEDTEWPAVWTRVQQRLAQLKAA